jgi:asparagine synthase (glutamine-hydrolysing)
MCGIAGFLTRNRINFDPVLKEMSDAIYSRGPDSSGQWFDNNNGIGLAHRRLSILDLSKEGVQPMISDSRRFIMVFNGEIYNHLQLRIDLESNFKNIKWRGTSDTETILKCIELLGIDSTFKLLEGMFSIGLWDKKNNDLILCRDRLGEKPLYYGWQGNTFLFSSELKAIKKHPDFNKIIDLNSLSLFFKYNYIPTPYSIYKGISKLTPGTYISINLINKTEKSTKYWDFKSVLKNKPFDTNKISSLEITNQLETLLKKNIKDQMLSDVPLGAFLSGGVDSSMVVALMQSISDKPIKTFTIGFDNKNFNEATYAKEIADYLKTDHTELYISPKDALDVVPLLHEIYDEPFADSSQIPTFLVSKLAKEKVTVSLSGDGGDELFAGYNRYILANKIWPIINFIPLIIRKNIGKALRLISFQYWNNLFLYANKLLPKKYKLMNLGDKIHKFSYLLDSYNISNLYDKIVSFWSIEDNIVKNHNFKKVENNFFDFECISDIEKMMALDTLTYLPDDILVKVDRAAMSVSLETRVPFLNHKLVEFASKIPLELKLKNNSSKWILKQVLFKYIPKKLIERPKMGFGVPIDSWLRGPLKNWTENLLSEKKLNEQGILNTNIIRKKWDEHLSGKRNWQYHLWGVLMFQAWYENH